jgi:hypothetical protein
VVIADPVEGVDVVAGGVVVKVAVVDVVAGGVVVKVAVVDVVAAPAVVAEATPERPAVARIVSAAFVVSTSDGASCAQPMSPSPSPNAPTVTHRLNEFLRVVSMVRLLLWWLACLGDMHSNPWTRRRRGQDPQEHAALSTACAALWPGRTQAAAQADVL